MRLGQLARKLDIKTEQIVSYIAEEKKIAIKEHPNSKVEDDLVPLIEAHFTPQVEEVETIVEVEEIVVKEEVIEEVTPEEPVVAEAPKHIETVKPDTASGPKIIGKIDLPDKIQINVEVDGVVYDQETLEAKKKEDQKVERERKIAEKEAAQKAAAEAKEQARIKREEEEFRKAKQEAERIEKKLQEKAKQDAIRLKKEEEERKALEKARKEKQKEHYNQKFKPKVKPNKTKKTLIQEPVATEKTILTQTEEVQEKSLYKRFIKWLNT